MDEDFAQYDNNQPIEYRVMLGWKLQQVAEWPVAQYNIPEWVEPVLLDWLQRICLKMEPSVQQWKHQLKEIDTFFQASGYPPAVLAREIFPEGNQLPGTVRIYKQWPGRKPQLVLMIPFANPIH